MIDHIVKEIISFITVLLNFIEKQIVLSSILFLFIMPLAIILRKRSPYWQYGLGAILFLRLILPPDFSSPLSLRMLLDKHTSIINMEIADINNGHEILEEPGLVNEIALTDNFQGQYLPFWNLTLFLLWAAGVTVFLYFYIRKLFTYHRMIKNARRVTDPSINRILNFWRSRFRLYRQAHIVTSDKFLSPFTIGIIRPKIFIPAALINNKNQQTIEAVISHELAHIKRFDDLWIKIQNLIQIFYFFNPLVWFANSRLNQARERICDRLVLREKIVNPKDYGTALIKILSLNTFGSAHLNLLANFSSQKKNFKERINEIVEEKVMRKSQSILVLIFLILFGIITLPMASHYTKNTESDSSAVVIKKEAQFIKPVKQGSVAARFGMRIHPILKIKRQHKGIDIEAPKGTKIYASADGVVIFAAKNGGYGNCIIIEHQDGYETRYGHLFKILVKPQQQVKRGGLIGLVGKSGLALTPHLHYEIRKDGKPLNPEEFTDFSGLTIPKDINKNK
jgi:bla regulator protein BlaR1